MTTPSTDSSLPPTSFPTDTGPDSLHWQATAPIAYSTIEMLREPLVNSADEMVYLLEVCLRHFGWLWLREYVQGQHHDPSLDQLLFQHIGQNDREPSVGTWAYLGSRISHAFRQHGWFVSIPPLTAFIYGDPRDPQTHLSKLLTYRNHFAHGSFDTCIQDILEHREYLWQLLGPMQPLFCHHPIVFWDAADGLWRRANGHGSPEPETPVVMPEPEPYHPFMRCFDGTWRSLFPFVQIALRKPQEQTLHAYTHVKLPHLWYIRYFDLRKSSWEDRQQLFVQSPSLSRQMRRYEQELQGYLAFQSEANVDPKPSGMSLPLHDSDPLLPTLQQALMHRHRYRPHTVLLTGYPGSGKTSWVTQAARLFPKFHITLHYQIRPNSPTLSPVTFMRCLLRELYQHKQMLALRKKSAHLLPSDTEDIVALSVEELDARFLQCLDVLKAHHKRVLLAIDQFHWANQTHHQEKLSISEWISRWQGASYSMLRMLLTVRPGYTNPTAQDEIFSLPVQHEHLSPDIFRLWLSEWGLNPHDYPEPDTPSWDRQEQSFRRAILYVLSKAPGCLSVWDIRDALKLLLQQQPHLFPAGFLFTPHVERSVYELRPLLSWQRMSITPDRWDTHYAIFCAPFQQWLQNVAL